MRSAAGPFSLFFASSLFSLFSLFLLTLFLTRSALALPTSTSAGSTSIQELEQDWDAELELDFEVELDDCSSLDEEIPSYTPASSSPFDPQSIFSLISEAASIQGHNEVFDGLTRWMPLSLLRQLERRHIQSHSLFGIDDDELERAASTSTTFAKDSSRSVSELDEHQRQRGPLGTGIVTSFGERSPLGTGIVTSFGERSPSLGGGGGDGSLDRRDWDSNSPSFHSGEFASRDGALGGERHGILYDRDGDDLLLQLKRQDQDDQGQTLGDLVNLGGDQSSLQGAKVLFATTITQNGAAAQAQETGMSAAAGTGGTDGGSMMVEVMASSSQMQTAVGMLTETCLTMVSDPTQKFCETSLDGQSLGNDAGLVTGDVTTPTAPDAAAPPPPSDFPAASTSQPPPPPSTSGDASSTASGDTSSNSTTSQKVDAVVNAPTAASNSSGEPGATTTSGSAPTTLSSDSASTSNSTVTPVVVNDPTAAPAGSAGNSTSPSTTSNATGTANDTAAAAPTAADGAGGPTGTGTANGTVTPAAAAAGAVTGTTNSTVTPVVVNDPTAQATAAQAAQDNQAAAVPGQQMKVLPIGLGVFGGLAGIALLVVGYVMFERKKYRGQFRRRKAAEKGALGSQAAPMGSGGYGTA